MSDKQKTPDYLLPALRQYQHNDCSGLLAGFDHDIIVEKFKQLQAEKKMLMEAFDNLQSHIAQGE